VIGETLDRMIRVEPTGGAGTSGDLPPELAMAVNDYARHSGSIRQPLPPDSVLALGIQVADALDSAHRKGVIHRDITPSNIVVTPEGQAKIVDFGLARMTSRSRGRASGAGDGEWGITGTITHMSPEQAQGLEVDPRTDLFSLGTVLYEISTGRRAFRGSTEKEILEAIVRRDPEPPGQINPALPSELERIIMKCLEKDPEDRYRTAGDLAEALRGASTNGRDR
jgi:serine/threonine protein kinase